MGKRMALVTRRIALDLTKTNLEDQILEWLADGPVISFGSAREVSAALERLKRRGLVRYVKISNGGNGWEKIA
jgi:hypothetical protein